MSIWKKIDPVSSPEDIALAIHQLRLQCAEKMKEKSKALARVIELEDQGADAKKAKEELGLVNGEIEVLDSRILQADEDLKALVVAEIENEISNLPASRRQLEADMKASLIKAGEMLGTCLEILKSHGAVMVATYNKLRSALGEYSDAPQAFREGVSAARNTFNSTPQRIFFVEAQRMREAELMAKDGLIKSYKIKSRLGAIKNRAQRAIEGNKP